MIVNVWRVIIKKVELALPSSDQPVFVGEVQFCKSWSMEAKWVSTFRKIAPTNEKHSTKLDVYRDALLSHQSDDFGGKIPLSVIWSDDVAPTSFFILLPFKTPAAALARNRWRLPGIPKWCIVSLSSLLAHAPRYSHKHTNIPTQENLDEHSNTLILPRRNTHSNHT